MKPLLPGATVGVLGGGQLGLMFVQAARTLGYRTHVFCPEAQAPAGMASDEYTVASFEDRESLRRFAQSVGAVTLEFENIPYESVAFLEQWVCVRPGAKALHTTQHRNREKRFLTQNGFPTVPYAFVSTPESVEAALSQVALPAVLKTAGFGYDGKGQHKIEKPEQLHEVVTQNQDGWVLEQWQDFACEVSVLVARDPNGQTVDWGTVENQHRNHILDLSVVPAALSARTDAQAREMARAIAEKLELVGILAVEFFVGRDGTLRVNELAPRPHNSGHWTLEGAVTSQFEQQVRCLCGLPLGSTERTGPTAMANVLGDVWAKGEPDWVSMFSVEDVKWHGYHKTQPRAGRKMGHLTAQASSREQAMERVLRARALLARQAPAGS